LSPAHFQKRFKEQMGVSPKVYQEACRLKKLKAELRNGKTVTEALYEVGHSSPSRVYEKLNEKIGMTPRQYQKQGQGLLISYAHASTVLGKMLLAATERGICFIQFGRTQKEMLDTLQDEFPKASIQVMPQASAAEFGRWIKALDAYLAGSVKKLDLPLDMMGTAFQIKVWKFLQKIPRGSTWSYSELAEKIGNPKAVRAVASACARNNLAIVIPCHRVLRGSGELAGYRWGLERKQALLELEEALK
jgi:AraC family transcriptional regulator of adaptative response/methylated-DNA-[protein]-cysteine methyltransferase